MSGWIKLYRDISKWEWYQDSQTFHFFFHCILKANHEPKKWLGIMIERGQFVASRNTLSFETGISCQSIRTCEARLEKSENLTIKTTNRFTIYTIENYELYQSAEYLPTNESTNGQQTTNKRLTTTKEDKELKEDILIKNTKKEIGYSSDFENFWIAYPRKDGSKVKAFKIYDDLLKKGNSRDEIIKGARAYAEHNYSENIENRYIKHAVTWLNQRCWEVEYKKIKPVKYWGG